MQQAVALESLEQLSAEVMSTDFDMEAANVLLALWSRVPEAARPTAAHETLIERIGLRYCVSRAMVEVLSAAAQRSELAVGVIRGCQARISGLTEQAMDLSLKGKPGDAARLLLQSGLETLNAKLLEMAGLMARRHQSHIPDAEQLIERSSAMLRACNASVSHIAGIKRSGRSPGGLLVRGRAATPANEQLTA
jgi:hypothetical protein